MTPSMVSNSPPTSVQAKPGDDTDLRLALDLAVAVLRHAEEVFESLLGDLDRLLLGDHQLLHRLAGECRQLTLQITHARFAGVAADHQQQGVIVDRPFLGIKAMLGDGVRDQMLARDLDLLVLGVAGDPDDLHAVDQRAGNIERIRGRDEHDVRQIVVDLQVVVGERDVLLGVEDLKQRRRRIAAEIGAHLVDLVQQEQRVRGLRLAHRLDDLAGHRADIGAAVTADFRLIAHAAERHAHELTPGRLRDRLAERGLADAGRADQAQDRSGQLVGARLHREILDDAVLDLLEPVVVVVQHGLRRLEILLDLGLLVPRDRQQPVEIVAHDRRFRGHRRHLAQLLQLVLRLLPRFLGKLGLGNLLFQIGPMPNSASTMANSPLATPVRCKEQRSRPRASAG